MSQEKDTETPKKGLPIKEFVAGMALVAVLMLFLFEAIHRQYEIHARTTCQYNLKQWALVFKMYANENKDELWPPVQRPLDMTDPRFSFTPDMNSICPNYLTDPGIAFCPSNPNYDDLVYGQVKGTTNQLEYHERLAKILDNSYVYWGWALDKVADRDANTPIGAELAKYAGIEANTLVPLQVKGAMQEAYTAYVTKKPLVWPGDFDVDDGQGGLAGTGKSNTVYRLRKGIERFLYVPPGVMAIANVAVMHDLFIFKSEHGDVYSNHKPAGMNVLFNDGHVEFVRREGSSNIFSDAYLSALAGALTN